MEIVPVVRTFTKHRRWRKQYPPVSPIHMRMCLRKGTGIGGEEPVSMDDQHEQKKSL